MPLDSAALPFYDKRKEGRYVCQNHLDAPGHVPARVLNELGVGPGDRLDLLEGPEGFTLRPKRIDLTKLGYLRDKIPPGTPPFDIRKFRDQGYDPYKYRD